MINWLTRIRTWEQNKTWEEIMTAHEVITGGPNSDLSCETTGLVR